MTTESRSYKPFFDFIDNYRTNGFQNIDPDSAFMLAMERMLEANNQFFFVGNLIHMKVLFTSKKSKDLIGVEPEYVDPSCFLSIVHPGDLNRLVLARTKLLTLGGELFIAKKGIAVISTSLRFERSHGNYLNQLVQCYLFYVGAPFSTVFIFQVNTDISRSARTINGSHYYVGDDISYFRYPDERLLGMGNDFSGRQFEIIKLVSEGLTSDQIAEKLFLSHFTIDTHRRNILRKSGKASMVELILDLKHKGIL